MADAVRCPSCGHDATAEDRFCPRCGKTLPGLSPDAHREIAEAPTVVTADGVTSSPGAATQPEAPPGPDPLEEQLRAALSPSFLLVRKLGQGGMAGVWLAREPALRRLVAVKVLSPQLAVEPSARARFEREAQAVAGLVHPNVVGLHGLGTLADGTPYFVMQYVGGRSLAARLEEEGPLDPDEVRRIVGEVAGALAAAHAKGIVHRDIKPANILYDDDTGRALVSDFGIAAVRKSGDAQAETRLTQTGMLVGTPQYMSPETLLGEAASEATDVYALGLLAYELVAGTGPFEATTPQALIAMHLRDAPPRLSTVRPEVEPEFERMVAACLEKEPARRPAAAAIAKQLAPGGGLALEWPPPGLDPLRGALRRWSMRFWTGDLLLVLVAALGFITFGARVQSLQQSLGTLLLALAAAGGTLALAVALLTVTRPLRRGAVAVRTGYAWLTVLETLADTRGDTGALIAGAREYASLEPRVRSALRLHRVVRESLVFVSAVLPLFLLLVLVRLAAADALPVGATPWLLIGPSALALAVAVGLGEVESRATGAARQVLARRRQRDDFRRLVEPWYASFDSVREGQALGRGRTGGAAWASAAGILVVTVGAAGLVALWPFWTLASVGPALWESGGSRIAGNTLTKVAIAERLRPWVLQTDTSITPLQAGEAYIALATMGRPDSGRSALRRPMPAAPLPPLPELPSGALFPQSNAFSGPDQMVIIEVAARGFSPAQIRWLEAYAAHPAWDAYRAVARAPGLDHVGAQFILPFPDTIQSRQLLRNMVAGFAGVKTMTYANASRAALYLALGRRDRAEEVLREGVSFGFQLVDHGATLLDALIGVVIVGISRYNLTQLYTITGRREGVRLQALTDSLRDFREAFGIGAEADAAAPKPSRSTWLAAVHDTTIPFPVRLELLDQAQIIPCTNLRELLFGPGRDVDSAFAYGRRALARYPSDSALLDVYERQAHLGPQQGSAGEYTSDMGGVREALLVVARALGRAAGAPRVAGCAELALAATKPRQ